MRGFDFAAPTPIPGALKAAKGKKYRFIAGGTNFLPDLRHMHDGLPQLVIDLSRVDALRGVSLAKGEGRMGALTTMTDFLENKIILRERPTPAPWSPKFPGPSFPTG